MILDRAQAAVPTGSALEPPVLSYDQHKDRLAWRVSARAPDASAIVVFVAGTTAWRAQNAGGGDATG